MSRLPIATIFISFAAVLLICSGVCFGFAIVRGASWSPSNLVVRPMKTTGPTSRFDPEGEEGADNSTDDECRRSTRKRLSNLTRRIREIFRKFKRISTDQEGSLDVASQGIASTIQIVDKSTTQMDNTRALISQGEKMTFALPSNDRGTSLDGVSPTDLLIETEEIQERIAPIENMSVIHVDDPVTTRHTRSAEHGK